MYHSRLMSALAMAALAAILVPSSLSAQITFQRTYGGWLDDRAYSVHRTADGGFIVAGRTHSFGAGATDVYLIRTDANGDTLWTKTCGGTDDDCGLSVRQTNDGGYVIAGYTESYGVGGDAYLIRIDTEGDTLWTRAFGGRSDDLGMSVQQTTDGGYIIAGHIFSSGAGRYDVYLVKTNASGDTLWTRAFGGTSSEEGYSVQQTTDGGYVIAGLTYSYGAGLNDVYLIRTDVNGDTLWTRTFGGTDNDGGTSVQQTSDSGYIIAGTTESFGAGNDDVYLIKTDASGDTLWTRTFGGASNEWGYSVQQTSDGGYIMTGYTESFGAGQTDVYLVKTDAYGDTLWTKTFGGADDDCGLSVRQTSDDGYVIAGWTKSSGAGGEDFYLIKTDSSGNVAVAEPKASPARAPALSLCCEPNPFRTRTAISLQLTADSPAELAIFDASGRRVRTLTVNHAPCTVWDGKDDFGQPLPSGAYFARLDAAGQHASTRIVLQR
jgi:hypothetical protein